jgi:hypothetical protein
LELKMNPLPFSAALCLALALSPAWAAPAPWYRWQSVTGEKVCAQTSPGPGWVRLEVAYVDPRCLRRNQRATDKAKNRK